MNTLRSGSIASFLVFALSLLVLSAMLVLSGCSLNKPHERAAQAKAEAAGLNLVSNPSFDGTYVAPGVSFAHYKRLLVEQLDVDHVDIAYQPGVNETGVENPWELNDADKSYYRDTYSRALIKNLVADGAYGTASANAEDVLVVRAKVLRIAPLASKDDFQGRPQRMKVYSKGMGTMTLEITLYDSQSGKAVGILTDERDLGRMWEENNRVTNNMRVRLAFDAWLGNLRAELDKLSHRS